MCDDRALRRAERDLDTGDGPRFPEGACRPPRREGVTRLSAEHRRPSPLAARLVPLRGAPTQAAVLAELRRVILAGDAGARVAEGFAMFALLERMRPMIPVPSADAENVSDGAAA